MHSEKNNDFLVFAEVIEIIGKGEHLKREGFNEIVRLVHRPSKTSLKKYSKEILLVNWNLRDYTSEPLEIRDKI